MKLNELTEPNLDHEMVEMANLTARDTGIEFGVIRVSSDEHEQGPRVKFYRKPGKNQPSATITISDDPEVLEKHSSPEIVKNLDSKEKDQIFQFVKINKDKLLRYWNEATEMTREESDELLNSLQKVGTQSKTDI